MFGSLFVFVGCGSARAGYASCIGAACGGIETGMSDGNYFAALDKHNYLSLETFRKNGAGVRTPVWFAADPSDGSFVRVTRSSTSIRLRTPGRSNACATIRA